MSKCACRLCDVPVSEAQYVEGFGRCVWCAYDDDRLQALETPPEARQ